ncbi:MAG: sugar ABC transporter permease, partial [Chloroflexi bacterium]|nr:sugar ABC transporter permease [Chloroflexota bacterium]
MWLRRHRYLMILPGLLYFIVFHYVPMWGVTIAFQEFQLWKGLFGSRWIGLENFIFFFNSPYFVRIMRNTLLISGLNLLIVFPAPIVLALLLNEVRHATFKRVIQTVSYFPHFISWVVIGGLLIYTFSTQLGFVNLWLGRLGIPPIQVLGNSRSFYPLVVASAIWKSVGWGAIIYLAALAGINPELY